MKTKIFLLFVAISLTSIQYHNIRKAVITGPHLEYKINSFISPIAGIKTFRAVQKYFWKARVFSCYSSSITCRLFGLKYSQRQPIKIGDAIATDQCIWLFGTFLLIIFFSKNPLLLLFGVFAALQYSWLPMSEAQINPWDMPSIFFWTLVLFVARTKHKRAILFIIPIAALYKEIIAVTSILILIWTEVPLKRRILLFVVIGSLCVAIKMIGGYIGGCEYLLGNQSFHYETVCRTGEYYIAHRNFHSLFWWSNFNTVYFSIAGVWIGLFILPIDWRYRSMAIIYFCTVFIPGNITEGRLWNEIAICFFIGYDSLLWERDQRKGMCL